MTSVPRVERSDSPFFGKDHQTFLQQVRESWIGPVLETHMAFQSGALSEDQAAKQFVRDLSSRELLKRAIRTDVRTLCLAREEVATCSGFADNQLALQGLGGFPIRLAGSKELQHRFFEPAAAGDLLAAFALTEPEAGSDTKSMQTSARRVGDEYILAGKKTLISNAGVADFYTVFARMEGQEGFVAVVVPSTTPGLVVDARFDLLAPHPIGRIDFEDCVVPVSHRLGNEGEGLKLAFSTLERFRPSVGAAALGLASRGLAEARDYVCSRVQFGKTLGRFQMIQAKVADMWANLELSRLAVYRAAWLLDQAQSSPQTTAASSLAKLAATESAFRIIDEVVQIFGGRGVVVGEVAEHLFRDVRALRIYEGTSEIQRLILAKEFLKAQQASQHKTGA